VKRRGVSKTWVVLGLLAVLSLPCLIGSTWQGELVFWLAAGWLLFLNRVSAGVTPDWTEVATGFAALAAFAVGLHLFLRWLYRAFDSTSSDESESSNLTATKSGWAVRWTLSAVAIAVMMFVAGISVVGITHQISWMLTSNQPILKANSFRRTWTPKSPVLPTAADDKRIPGDD
jgi:hypothetical protein